MNFSIKPILTFLIFIILMFYSESIFSSDFQEVDGREMRILDDQNRKSYDLFESHIQKSIDKIYFKGSGGLSFAIDVVDLTYIKNSTDVNLAPYVFSQKGYYPILLSFGTGIKISKFFNIEFFADTRLNQYLKLSSGTDYLTYKLNLYGFGISLSMDILNSYDFVPYMGVGGGIYWNSAKVIEQTTKFAAATDFAKDHILHYRIILGGRYKINRYISLFAEYGYKNFGEFKGGDFFANEFSLGIIVN